MREWESGILTVTAKQATCAHLRLRVGASQLTRYKYAVAEFMTKMELLLWREWPKLRRMGNDLGNIASLRARLEEADAAFALLREYFAMAGVVLREDPEKFIQEYFGQ